MITQPKVGKMRFSDRARDKAEMKAKKGQKSPKKPKKVKHDNAKPAPLTTTESVTRQMESAPLGLNGVTAAKQKKKKAAPVNTGEKTRLSDRKKAEQKRRATTWERLRRLAPAALAVPLLLPVLRLLLLPISRSRG